MLHTSPPTQQQVAAMATELTRTNGIYIAPSMAEVWLAGETYGICNVCAFNPGKSTVNHTLRFLTHIRMANDGALVRTHPIDHRQQTQTSSRPIVELLLRRRRRRRKRLVG